MKRPAFGQVGWRFNVADPDAYVPVELLVPDGRYSCDRCEGLAIRAELIELPEGFICPVCAGDEVTIRFE